MKNAGDTYKSLVLNMWVRTPADDSHSDEECVMNIFLIYKHHVMFVTVVITYFFFEYAKGVCNEAKLLIGGRINPQICLD